MESSRPDRKLVYILADNRSGSTLLDQLLGAHDQVVSVGEVHHLRAYVCNDRSLYDPKFPLLCSCGQSVTTCTYWSNIESELGATLESLSLELRFLSGYGNVNAKARSLKALPRNLLMRRPFAYRNGLIRSVFNSRRVAADSFRLFDAIFAVTNARYVVDSSKTAFRFRSLYEHRPNKILAVTLARDYRATVHSKMKRQKSLESSAKSWAMRMQQIEALTTDLPARQLFRIRYEDLCGDPKKELSRLCDFLDLDFSDALLSRPEHDVHHVGGSPSQFDPARKEIQLDTSYRNAFSLEQLDVMKQIVGPVASLWGYD